MNVGDDAAGGVVLEGTEEDAEVVEELEDEAAAVVGAEEEEEEEEEVTARLGFEPEDWILGDSVEVKATVSDVSEAGFNVTFSSGHHIRGSYFDLPRPKKLVFSSPMSK
jgi:hypothetical protein